MSVSQGLFFSFRVWFPRLFRRGFFQATERKEHSYMLAVTRYYPLTNKPICPVGIPEKLLLTLNNSKMRRRKYIGLYLLIILTAAAVYGYWQYNRTRDSVITEQPDFVVEADSLIKEFSANEEAASVKYGGLNRVMLVRGMVKNVEISQEGNVIVILGDTLLISSVRCLMDSMYRAEAIKLHRGSQAGLKGYFSGYKADITGILGGDAELNACLVVP